MIADEANEPRLVVTSPASLAGTVLALRGPELVIGHSGTADIVLDDRFVSRRHALVTIDPTGAVTIRDLNSTSGTFVNGERLTGARLLQPGDVVQFADLVTRFEPAGPGEPTTTPPDATTVVTPAGSTTARDTPTVSTPTVSTPTVSTPGEPSAIVSTPTVTTPTVSTPGEASAIVIAETYYTVTGTVTSPALPGLGGLTVQLVDKNVGGDQVITSTQTGGDGSYAFTQVPISDLYLGEHYKTAADLQAQVYAGGTLLAASAVAYSAPATLTLDVVLPAGTPGLPSEYETLAASLAAVYPGNLADLQEGGGRSDLTYLGNKIELDVRAVALAALSNQLSQMTAPVPAPPGEPGQTQVWPTATASLAPEFYYALLRAGLPATPDGLFRVSPATATAIWQQAMAGNVIPQQLVKELPSAAASFQALSAAQLLTAPPQAGLSTLQEMLAPTLPDPDQQQQFASLYAQYQGNWAGFWPAVEQALGTEVAGQLQLTGQLNYVMGNNQQLVAALTQAEAGNPITTAADLASRGYYEAAAWTPLIGSSVPPGIPGADPGEQAAGYAQVLAAQVRLAYPTAVLADQVRRSVMPIADTAGVAAGVADFLDANQGSFEIGVEPVQAFIARTGLAGTPDAVVAQVQRLQRVYQLTPDDASMAVLLGHNLDSAFAVTRYDPAGFVRALGDQLGGADPAAAIHQRARQVFASVLSVAVGYLGARSAPVLGGAAPVQYGLPPQPAAAASPTAADSATVDPAAAYPVPAYPTLEELFGSLDFCNCSDCGSVLSPAAYLVDLLNYLDQPAPAAGFDNPQDTLLQRRPDLQYLPLTCANTNTALPYIDIVNETLEYLVANGLSLAGYTGHDTGDTVTSAELIASPQYVDDAAYTILEGAFFPAPLPFSRPLELLRLQLASLVVTLPDAMTALRASDDLTDTRTPTSYGWRDILIERLGISRPEYRLFTDPALQLGDLYGLPVATALATLQTTSLRDFSRRLGVSYDDLTAIVSTQFINPSARLIPRLERLDAPFSTLQALHDTLGTPESIAAEFIAALPAGLDATEYGGASPTDYQAVVAWVTGPQVYPLIMDIITISNPSGSASDCSGADLQLRYANPDNTANLLSGTDFIKLIRFIRLWRKLQPLLGNPDNAVTIAQTDAILAALYPAADLPADSSNVASDPANRALLDAGFTALLPQAGFAFQVLSLLSLTAGQALGQLLACWAPIGTAGPGSLYQAMFLTPTLLQQDPGAQVATVAGTVNVGDVLTTTINGAGVSYTVAPGDTAASSAAAITAAINAQTTPDPASGLPLNGRFVAASPGNVITITAGVTLACALSAGASETYTAAGTPVSWSATVGGPVTAGDTLITQIDTVPVPYPVVAGDTPATVAAGIAAAVNAATTADPYSGLPLNGLVVASSAGPVVTVAAANAGAPFTLGCSLQAASAGTYAAAPPVPAAVTATITGPVQPGDTLVTTVNAVAVPYTAGPGDTGPAQLAASIAAAIGAAVQADPATGLPLGTEIRAASAGGVITVTAVDPATPLALTCAVTAGAEQYTATGPVPETATATVAGTIPAGATLTTTINTLPVPYLAAPGDTPATIAAAIAAAVNAATATDPVTGLPLNAVVTASAAAGVITFTGLVPTTPFTLAAALSAGGYTAGRRNPPFADDGYGDFLTDPAQTLLGHEPTLCAACHLTGAEFALITAALGFDASTPLTLDNVSALLRYGWLAHALGLSVREFLLLRQYTGLDPFAPPDPAPAPPAQPPVITFIALLGALAATGLDTTAALYLVWNADIAGNSAPTTADVTGLALTLVADFAAVQAAFTLQDDPDGSIAEGLMTLVYGSAASDFFFGLLNGTLTALATQQAVGPFFASYPELQPLYDAYTASSDSVQARRQALLDAFLPILTAKRKQEQALAAVTSAAGTDPSFATALLQDPAILHADADASQPAVTDLTAIESQGLTAQFFLGNDPSAAPAIQVDAAPVLSYGTGADDGGGPLPPGSGGGPIAGVWSGYLTAPQDGTYAINVAADPGAAVTLELGGAAVAMTQAGGVWSSQDPVALTAGQLVPITLTATSIATTLSVSWQSLGLGWQVIPTGYLYPRGPVTRLGHTYLRFLKAAALASALSLTAAEIGYLATAPGFPVTGQSWLNALAADGAPDPPVAAALTGVLTGLLDVARIKQALSPADERLLAVLRDPLAILQNGQSALLSLTGWSLASVNSLLTQFFGSADLAALSSVANLARVYDAYAVVTTCGLTASAVIAGITNAPSADTVSALQSALRAQYAESDWLTVIGPINDRARVQQRDALVGYVLQQLGDGDAPSPLPVQTADDLYASLLIDTQTQPPVLTSRIRLALSAVQLFIERVLRNLEPGVWPGDVNASQWAWMKRYRVWQANREVFLWPENWLFPELRDNPSPFFQQMMSSLLQGDITDDAAASAYLTYLTSLEEVAKLEPCGMYYQPGSADADETSYVVARTAGAHRTYYFRELSEGAWTPWAQAQVDCEDLPITPIVWNGRLFLFWLKVIKRASPQQPNPSDLPGGALSGYVGTDVQKYAQAAVQAQNTVAVHATLCWTEYYNGTWQPAKTSDVNRPALIGSYDATGPGAFENYRSQVRIVPAQFTGASPLAQSYQVGPAQFTLPDDGLMLAITVAGSASSGGFILHNTHSLPIIFDDVTLNGTGWLTIGGNSYPIRWLVPLAQVLDPPNPSRSGPSAVPYTGGYGGGTFELTYQAAPGSPPSATSDILAYTWQPQWVDAQPGLADAWDAPFLYEDRRNLFYVTTTEQLVPVWGFQGFGVPPEQALALPQLPPPLVLRQPAVPPLPGELLAANAGAGDPATVQRFLVQGTNLRAALPGQLTVTYQGQVISPTGSLPAPAPPAPAAPAPEGN